MDKLKLDGEYLIKLMKTKDAPIETYVNTINTCPIFKKDFPFEVYDKEEQNIIKDKIRSIAIKCVETSQYIHDLNNKHLKKIENKIDNNEITDDEIEEIKDILKDILKSI